MADPTMHTPPAQGDTGLFGNGRPTRKQATRRDTQDIAWRARDGTMPARVVQAILASVPRTKLVDGAYRSTQAMTCDQLETALGGTHQSVSAAVNKLAKNGLLKDSSYRDLTRSGRPAILWELTPLAIAQN